jgi:nucleotide-binding universal stress UspA family protein
MNEALAIALAVWLAIGVTLAVVMGRRGHGAFQWLILGSVLGPLALPLAWARVRDEALARPHELAIGVPGPGTVDVLVGLDGSAESETALTCALELLGTRIGRLTLARVTEFDDTSAQARKDAQTALDSIQRSAVSANLSNPGMIILSGRPADALTKEAREGGYELVVIGRRGRGASKALLGSTASRLASGIHVPVLMV